jgi:hypothetical protein
MRRFESLRNRIARLQPEPEWVDDNCDNFLTALGALPGESAEAALRRQAPIVWADHIFPDKSTSVGGINDDE